MSAIAALLLSLFGTDRLGDSTPPGVIARYGTTRLCTRGARYCEIIFHPTRDELYLTRLVSSAPSATPWRSVGWNLRTGEVVCRSGRGSDPEELSDLRFDTTGRYRLETRGWSAVRVWDTNFDREVRTVSFGDAAFVEPLGVFGDRLAVCETRSRDRMSRAIRFRRLSDGQPVGAEVRVPSGATVSITPDGSKLLVVDARDKQLREYDTATGSLLRWHPLATVWGGGVLDASVFSADGGRLFVVERRTLELPEGLRGPPECFIQVLDTRTRRISARYTFRLDDDGVGLRTTSTFPFGEVAISDNGEVAAWITSEDRLILRHLPSGRAMSAEGGRYAHGSLLKFSPDGKRLAVVDQAGLVRLVDPATGRLQAAPGLPATAVHDAAVSPDGARVAATHADGSVSVWDAKTGAPLWRTEITDTYARWLRFDRTGATLAVVTTTRNDELRIHVRDAATGRLQGDPLVTRYPGSVVLIAKDRHVIDVVDEKAVKFNGEWEGPLSVRVRDATTGREVRRTRLDFQARSGSRDSVVLSDDGRVAVVTHNDRRTHVYDTATGKRIADLTPSGARHREGFPLVSSDVRFTLRIGADSVSRHRTALLDLSVGREVAFARPLNNGLPVAISGCGRYMIFHKRKGPGQEVEYVEPEHLLFDLRSRAVVWSTPLSVPAFFPDGKSVLTLPDIRGAERVSLEPLIWKVAPPKEPTAKRLIFLWDRLAEPGAPALDAVFELARFPAVAVPFLKARLLTDPADAKAVAGHIEKLGSRLFAEREYATKALRELGPEVLPALREALKTASSPEARSRIEKLLPELTDTAAPLTLAQLRAVEVLERCGTPESRAALDAVAKRTGPPWVDAAARALGRLGR